MLFSGFTIHNIIKKTERESRAIIFTNKLIIVILVFRWSAIAAKLPGRTDNEIKNVWHTHLKKRLMKTNNHPNSDGKNKRVSKPKIKRSNSNSSTITQSEHASDHKNSHNEVESTTSACTTSSSSSDFSSVTVGESKNNIKSDQDIESMETIVPEIDESFWSEAAAMDETSTMPSQYLTISNEAAAPLFQLYPFNCDETFQNCNSNFDDGMDFWYDIFIKTGDPIELPEF